MAEKKDHKRATRDDLVVTIRGELHAVPRASALAVVLQLVSQILANEPDIAERAVLRSLAEKLRTKVARHKWPKK